MKKRTFPYHCLMLCLSYGFLLQPMAEAKTASSLADIANNILFGADFVTDFLHVACLSIGIGFVIYSFIAYRNHRMNPKLVPLDRPIVYLILGLVLASVPFLNTFLGVQTGYTERHNSRSDSQVYPLDLDAPIEN